MNSWMYMSSQSWTPLPPPTPYHLSGSSPCTSPKHPVSCIEHRMALKHVYYHVRNVSPVYVQYRIQDTWGWCTGMIQRDDMGWEVGGGFMFGNSCTPVADSCQCIAWWIQLIMLLYTWNFLRKKSYVFSPHVKKMVTMWSDGYIN